MKNENKNKKYVSVGKDSVIINYDIDLIAHDLGLSYDGISDLEYLMEM